MTNNLPKTKNIKLVKNMNKNYPRILIILKY